MNIFRRVNRYIPCSYEEHKDGSVTVTCTKVNDKFPIFGGYSIFRINPDDLEEDV